MFVRGLVVSFALVLAVPGQSDAGWSLPECWRNFWRGNPSQEKLLARNSHKLIGNATKSERGFLTSWAQTRKMPQYGLASLPAFDDDKPLVVFVHGLNSRPEDLGNLISRARVRGHRCTTFRYPNDQAVEKSARLLARELRRIETDQVVPVFLVTHSMGGLVARAVIEDPQLDPGNVRRLVMIGPPNHGSNLARYACSLDVYEYLTSQTRRAESGLIAGCVSDGLSQATRDLQPGSEFLRRLNARRRNRSVAYSLVLGTAGPLDGTELGWLETVLELTQGKCSWMKSAKRQYEQHFLANREMFSGQGDGFVSVRLAQLDGVSDIVFGHFTHGGILGGTQDPEVARVQEHLLSRLD